MQESKPNDMIVQAITALYVFIVILCLTVIVNLCYKDQYGIALFSKKAMKSLETIYLLFVASILLLMLLYILMHP